MMTPFFRPHPQTFGSKAVVSLQSDIRFENDIIAAHFDGRLFKSELCVASFCSQLKSHTRSVILGTTSSIYWLAPAHHT